LCGVGREEKSDRQDPGVSEVNSEEVSKKNNGAWQTSESRMMMFGEDTLLFKFSALAPRVRRLMTTHKRSFGSHSGILFTGSVAYTTLVCACFPAPRGFN